MGQTFTIQAEDTFLKAPGRKCELYITSNQPLPRTTSLASIFSDIDTNSDGTISPRELCAYLRKRGITIFSNKQLMKMFKVADDNNDYEITFSEFRRVMAKAQAKTRTTAETGFIKWKQLLISIQDEVRPSFELRLCEVTSPHRTVSTKPVLGNGSTLVQTNISVGFTAGRQYYISLYQIETNLEVARSNRIQCQDHASVVAERVQAQMQRDISKQQKVAAQRRRFEQVQRLEERRQREERQARLIAARSVARQEVATLEHARNRNAVVLLQQLFEDIDTNRNGRISFLELKKFVDTHAVGHHDVVVDRQQLIAMFREADVDYSLEITFDEFQRIMFKAKNANAGKRWREMYEGFEQNIRSRRVRRRVD